MSTSSDLKIGEAIRHRFLVIETATGNPWLLQNPLVTVIDESGNQAVAAAATEESNGWYHYDFTPDAAGSWTCSVALAGATIYHSPLLFKVGSVSIGDTYDKVNTEVADIKAKTDNLPIDPADESSLETAITNAHTTTNGKVDVIDGFHDVPAQNSANNAQMRDAVGNKTDTTAGNSVIALLKQIVEDTGTTLDDLVDDLETRLSAVRAGYLDRLANRTQTVTFFSPYQALATLDTTHTDAALPTVTVPNWAGLTLVHVYVGVKWDWVDNSNVAANKLSGAQEIQVNKAGGAWTDAINFVDDMLSLPASTLRAGGGCAIGIIDLVGTIDVFNTTVQFQWDEPLTDQDSILLYNIQTFVIIQYY